MAITILQQQLDGYKKSPTNPAFVNTLFKEHPDPEVLLLSGVCYACKHNLMNQLQNMGYKLIFPAQFDKRDLHNLRITCGTLAAVKDDIIFEQSSRDSIKTQYRYIEGTLQREDTLEIFFAHAPNTYLPYPKAYDRKKNMINSATDFLIENQTTALYLGGNYATALDGSTSMENLFGMMYSSPTLLDTDTTYNPTWRNKRLDYAFVSSPLRNRCSTRRITTALDHVGLMTEIA